jgi:hypothetical protein
MNDNLMFDYLLEMGAMRPEQEELRRKQAMVDALRGQAMTPMQGQMVGKHYVAPGIANAIAQMGTAYMAGQQQKGVDAAGAVMNERQRRALEDMRRRRQGMTGTGVMDYGDRDPLAGY